MQNFLLNDILVKRIKSFMEISFFYFSCQRSMMELKVIEYFWGKVLSYRSGYPGGIL